MEKDVNKSFLPEQLVEYFVVESITELPIPCTKRFQLHIHLVEKNVLPAGHNSSLWESNGFTEQKKVHDFPLRGYRVLLLLQCRRWRHKSDPSRVIRNDITTIDTATRISKARPKASAGTGIRF